MTITAHTDDDSYNVPTVVRRRREASRRMPPTRRGWRDPLDELARDRPDRGRRRPMVPFVYVDHHGNVRDESGAVLRSRLDVLLDAYRARKLASDPMPAVQTPADAPAPRCGVAPILARQRALLLASQGRVA